MGLYKRGKTYWCSITDPKGKLIRKTLKTCDKRTAETIFAKMRTQIELQRAGVLPEELPTEAPTRSLQEIVREFLDKQKVRGRSASYFHSFDLVIRQIVAVGAVTCMSALTAEAVQKWAAHKKATGNKGQTINAQASLFGVFTAWATGRGYLDKDPMASWERLREDEKAYRRDLNDEEVAAILRTEEDPEYRLIWFVYFFTGLRRGAGIALSWDWIDWEGRILILPLKNNKSGKEHRLPLHPGLYDALALRHNSVGRPKAGAVFATLKYDTILYRFRRVCRIAGIDPEGVCLHSVRHTVATRIYEASGSLKAAQEVLGHANVATTAIYLHVDDELKRSAVESLNYSRG